MAEMSNPSGEAILIGNFDLYHLRKSGNFTKYYDELQDQGISKAEVSAPTLTELAIKIGAEGGTRSDGSAKLFYINELLLSSLDRITSILSLALA
jgi:hypothetical protein